MASADSLTSSSLRLNLYLPLAWVLLLAVAAVLLPGRIWNTLLVGLGGLFVIAYWWAREMQRGLSGSRQLRFGWIAVGDRLSERFEIRNDSYFPALWVELSDESNVPGYQASVVRSLGAHSSDQWRQSAVCRRRGQYRLGPWALHTADPFGIFRVSHHFPAAGEIIIHPPVDTRIPVALPAGRSSDRQRARSHAWEATVNAATVRDYRPGDPMRWIHWPLSAHRDQLLTRHFDQDVGGDVWLLLDLEAAVQLRSPGNGADALSTDWSSSELDHAGQRWSIEDTEEYAVLLAAALAAQALQQNRAVGLAGYGREPQLLPPTRGEGQQWKLLRHLALLQADGDTALRLALHDLNRVARRGTTAVIITPSDRTEWLPGLLPLAQKGIQSSVILLDRASFGNAADGATAALQQAILQMGFNCSVLRRGELRSGGEPTKGRGFWEFRVLATGKVVTVRRPTD
jgi:uncharacterized protein (DUF58 family)